MRHQPGRNGAAVVAASAAFVGGVYMVFPAALALACRIRPRPLAVGDAGPRSLSVVIAAHDEAASIGAKLDDVAAQVLEGATHVQVLVASDGSSDDTVAIARRHSSRPVVLDLPRRGKAAAMNAAVAAAVGDVVVFTDANSRLAPTTFAALIRPFDDPGVGGVAGDQRYEARPSGTSSGERSYWSFERSLKRWESCIGSVVSATGTLHAIRRELIDVVPGDVSDDFYLSTGVVARHRRLVFAADAVAWEIPNEDAGAGYRRRVRIVTRGLSGVRRRRELLDPRHYGAYSIVLAVHKVARRLVFVPMVLGLLGTAAARRRGPWWRIAFLGQATFYGVAAAGAAAPGSWLGRRRALALPAHFCGANLAAAHAALNVVRSKSYVTWTPERS